MQKEWIFETDGEKRAIALLSIAGAVTYGATLASIFNPVAAGVIGVYAAFVTMKVYAYPHFSKDRQVQATKPLSEEGIQKIPYGCRARQELDDISQSYQLEKAPTGYWITPDVARQIFIPWYLRFIPISNEQLQQSCFAASGQHNAVFFLHGSGNSIDRSALRFIYAHELGHLKIRDGFSSHAKARFLCRAADRALLPVIGLAYAANLSGLTATEGMSVNMFAAAGLWIGARVLSTLFLNAASRIQEYRADRNALFITGEFNEERLGKILGHEKFGLDISTHPSGGSRLDAMASVWGRVPDYKRPEKDLMPRKKNPDFLSQLSAK